MKAVLLAAVISLVGALFGTPMYIKFLVRRGYGQFIRDDGPTSHHTKRGTPTMGGAVIIGSSLAAYGLAHAIIDLDRKVLADIAMHEAEAFSAIIAQAIWSGVLVLFLMSGLGLVGFLDDYIKISKQRSLGLRAQLGSVGDELLGQLLVEHHGIRPALRGAAGSDAGASAAYQCGGDLEIRGRAARGTVAP